jgi:hypothetical protein
MAALEAARTEGVETQAQGSLLVYLVHGTWGRGYRPDKTLLGRPRTAPIWSEPGSGFHDDLRAALLRRGFEPRLTPVHWPGSNSVFERDRVARFLARILDDDVQADPTCRQLVIAHSHGGNIALDAARHYRQSETDIQIVTLATPFVDLWTAMPVRDGNRYTEAYGRAFYYRDGLTRTRRALSCLAATLVFAWAGIRLGVLPPLEEMVMQGRMVWVAFMPLALNMLLALALTWTGAGEDELMRVPRLDAPRKPGISRCRMLVLRGADDEAALALAGGSLQAVLGSAVSRLSLVLLALVTLAGPFSLVIILKKLPGGWLHTALVALCAALAVFLTGSLLEAIGRAAAGREFLLMGRLLRISINSAPDTDGDASVRTLPGSPSKDRVGKEYRFKHGLYAHRDCVPAIVGWLGERLDA